MKKLTFILLSFLLILGAAAQKVGHKIALEVPQLANSSVLLAYHYGSKQYITDTFYFDSKGKVNIEGEEKLHHGVYLVVFPALKNKYFEMLVKEQFFSVKVPDTAKISEPVFVGSEENTLFYKDMKAMNEVRKQSQVLENQLKVTSNEAEKKKLQEQLETLNKNFTQTRIQFMESNPKLLYSDILGMLREIEIPKDLVNEKGEPDKNKQFYYFRKHYWDFTNFNEEGILRSPVLEGKLNDFFDKYTVKTQDSLIASCDIVLQKALVNDKVFQYFLVTLVNKYANSKVMGDDAVYVHLVKNYYESDKAWWVDEEQLAKMKERRMALEPLLIGKMSPDLTLRDTTISRMYRLYDLPSDYTIVFIWDPDCGHCKKEAPKLLDFYSKHNKDGIMVYAITTSNFDEMDKWKDFIKEKNLNWINVGDLYNQTNFRKIYDVTSTPQVFVLDKDKKIIAKRIGVEQLEGFFHMHMKNLEDQRYQKFVYDEKLINGGGEHSEDDGHGH
jgi:thiol-disulfide isomerase/thioredoxin